MTQPVNETESLSNFDKVLLFHNVRGLVSIVLMLNVILILEQSLDYKLVIRVRRF